MRDRSDRAMRERNGISALTKIASPMATSWAPEIRKNSSRLSRRNEPNREALAPRATCLLPPGSPASVERSETNARLAWEQGKAARQAEGHETCGKCKGRVRIHTKRLPLSADFFGAYTSHYDRL